MPMSLLSERHDGQVDQLKRLQQGFLRRTTGGAFGVACIQAWQTLVLVCQVLAAPPLQQGQESQGQREQVNDARCPLVTGPIHPGQRERLAFSSSNTTPTPLSHPVR